MPSLRTSSDLLEVDFTHVELNTAMQLMDKNLSMMYLQNKRVQLVRMISAIKYNDLAQDENQIRQHANLVGQMDMLAELIEGCLNPTQIPINPDANAPAGFPQPQSL